MAKPLYQATGRTRMRCPWWAPWKKRREYEIRMVLWDSRLVWFTRDQVNMHCHGILGDLPE
jgi:hypothetical protein